MTHHIRDELQAAGLQRGREGERERGWENGRQEKRKGKKKDKSEKLPFTVIILNGILADFGVLCNGQKMVTIVRWKE